ncbi:MAG: DUF2130 domain-containing protein [Phycisphaerales bacterium]|nr:DUF2130 domain-containing protein [Phycisphaerales bacterium]
MTATFNCPKCQIPIEITEVMTSQLRDRLRGELDAELAPERTRLSDQAARLAADRAALEKQSAAIDEQVRQRLDAERKKLVAEARDKAAADVAVELRDRDEQLREAQAKLKAAADQELARRKKERELQAREEAIAAERDQLAQQAQQQLAAERQKLIEEGRKKAAEEADALVRERDEELAGLRDRLKTANEQELALRKRQRELEERAEQMQLEIDRKLDAERQQIREAARNQAGEEFELKLRDEQQKNDALRKQIDDLKRRAEQGSQQAQGETLELVVEEMLADAFRSDRIEEVRKGVHGADVLQHVLASNGAAAGTILWETKRAKNWAADWLRKAREDQREAGAAVAIIVSEVLPPGVAHVGIVEGVWVTSRACAIALAKSIRIGMLEAANARRAMDGQHGKMESVYGYLTGVEFKNRVAGMLEPLVAMQQTLEKEKVATQRGWAAREKQIDQALGGLACVYGDLQGIIGGSLPRIEALELPESPEPLAAGTLALSAG